MPIIWKEAARRFWRSYRDISANNTEMHREVARLYKEKAALKTQLASTDEIWDSTVHAHPAWRRGCDHGSATAAQLILDALTGPETRAALDGALVINRTTSKAIGAILAIAQKRAKEILVTARLVQDHNPTKVPP